MRHEAVEQQSVHLWLRPRDISGRAGCLLTHSRLCEHPAGFLLCCRHSSPLHVASLSFPFRHFLLLTFSRFFTFISLFNLSSPRGTSALHGDVSWLCFLLTRVERNIGTTRAQYLSKHFRYLYYTLYSTIITLQIKILFFLTCKSYEKFINYGILL